MDAVALGMSQSARMERALFVLVAGPPGSGKTTMARPLAEALGLPLIAKDRIKEALMDVLGPPANVEESRRLGRASVTAMLAIAATSPGAVLDSTFYPYTRPLLEALPGPIVEVRCVCPRELAKSRYRARTGTRHPGHFEAERPDEELWDEVHTVPLDLGPVISVDTSRAVDIAALAAEVEMHPARLSGEAHRRREPAHRSSRA